MNSVHFLKIDLDTVRHSDNTKAVLLNATEDWKTTSGFYG